ncbi:hypothetical protein RZP54_29535, partial [Raoultella ornithinolytica]|nr:hypothetical protein [Raoultella ornithinolytica]
SAQIREILISESAWEEMTCLFAPSLVISPFGAGPEGVSGVPRIIERSSMESPYCRKQKTSPQAGFFKLVVPDSGTFSYLPI